MNKTPFFALGLPKSGTTFLQRTLNLHPEIHCPSEHQLDFLIQRYEKIFSSYNENLNLVDKRTGGQGANLISSNTVKLIFRDSVYHIMNQSSGDANIVGLNDNAIIHKLGLYNRIFNNPKMIIIIRHPANVAVSAWKHNERLARTENNKAHTQLNNRYGGFEGWVLNHAKTFSFTIRNVLKEAKQNQNLKVITYEELIENKPERLKEIFEFLGASVSPGLINSIVEDSSFESMKKSSTEKGFFRSQEVKIDPLINQELLSKIETIAKKEMKQLGYL